VAVLAGDPWPSNQEREAEVVAPARAQLVRWEGQPEPGRYVRHVVFRSLEFSHTDWTMDPREWSSRKPASA
jgi:hypothetical protein